MEFECDYDIYGDTRNRKGKIKKDFNGHNKGYKEQQRIYYVKEKRLMQSLADRGIDEEDDKDYFDETDNSRKRKLKYTADENDRIYGNNYSPVEKKNKKKKNSKKDKVRF